MAAKILSLEDFKKQPRPEEKHYNRAMTVQRLIDILGFADRKAKVYVRNNWMVGVVQAYEYEHGVLDKPTVLLYLNEEELPKQ